MGVLRSVVVVGLLGAGNIQRQSFSSGKGRTMNQCSSRASAVIAASSAKPDGGGRVGRGE